MAQAQFATVLRRLRHFLRPAPAEGLTDRQLLERFAAGEESAFEAVVRRHAGLVMGVCRRVLGDAHAAEDAFQATFWVLARRAGSLPWQESAAGWLYAVAQRIALRAKADAVRRQAQERRAADMPTEHADEGAGPELA